MAESLKTDPVHLQLSAGHLDMANHAAKTGLTRNASALASSQTGWVGSSFGAFEQLRDHWEHADEARAKRLDDIATALRRSAAAYQFADEGSAQVIRTTL